MSRTLLAWAINNQGRGAEAEALQRETLGIQTRVLGPEHPKTLGARINLAVFISGPGRYAEAEALERETLAIQTRVLGPDHPNTVLSRYNLACDAALQGKRADALSQLREAVERGYSHPIEQDPTLSTLLGDPEFEKIATAARENHSRGPKRLLIAVPH